MNKNDGSTFIRHLFCFYDLIFLLARSSSLSLSLLSLLLLELLELLEPSLPLLLLSDLRRLLPSFLRRFLSCERFDT